MQIVHGFSKWVHHQILIIFELMCIDFYIVIGKLLYKIDSYLQRHAHVQLRNTAAIHYFWIIRFILFVNWKCQFTRRSGVYLLSVMDLVRLAIIVLIYQFQCEFDVILYFKQFLMYGCLSNKPTYWSGLSQWFCNVCCRFSLFLWSDLLVFGVLACVNLLISCTTSPIIEQKSSTHNKKINLTIFLYVAIAKIFMIY